MRKIFFVLALAFLAAVIVACCGYLLSDRSQLVAWYLHLNGCFYRSAYWSTSFFTPGIKSDGNMYCIIAIIIAINGIFYIGKYIIPSRQSKTNTPPITFNTNNALPVLLCILSGIGFWLWGNGIALPAYDEVFSAQNAAGIHPFQCISYYMLPNNHLLFNFINATLFHWAGDKIETGRIISLAAYCSLLIMMFYWFQKFTQSRWLSLLAAITVGLQFQVWGFSFQARGYELYLLAEWSLVISLLSYLLSFKKEWLYVNILSCAAGYFCMPSFFYLHAAEIVFILLYCLFYKKKVITIWKAQVTAILLTFLLYLPVLCFSGLDTIAKNGYVAPIFAFQKASESVFLSWMFLAFAPNISNIFSDVHWHNISFNMLLYLLPLVLLFNRKKKQDVLFGMFYMVMWLVFLFIAIYMRRLPFGRNLIGHNSITLVGVLFTAMWITHFNTLNKKSLPTRRVIFAFVLALFSVHFFGTNKMYLKDTLYEYDVNKSYTEVSSGLSFLPPGSSAAFSNEAFYCLYISRRNSVTVSKCLNGGEDYFIKQRDERLPVLATDKYILVKEFDPYEVYKRK